MVGDPRRFHHALDEGPLDLRNLIGNHTTVDVSPFPPRPAEDLWRAFSDTFYVAGRSRNRLGAVVFGKISAYSC